jgi:probable rRNA maturation factor
MVLNRQKRLRIRTAEIAKFMARLQRELKVGRRDVTVCFVSNGEIARLNRRFRKKPRPTDVLSFPAHATDRTEVRPDGATPHLGDIAISPEMARRNAKQFGRSLDSELRVLILHGILHLLGYDHESDNGKMERKELRLRRKLGLK